MLTPFAGSEKDCLNYDPFAGDFGGSDDRELRDKMVTARKAGPCHDCGSVIQPGERVRSKSAVFDGGLMSWRWCQLCCEAMAISWTDDGVAIEARYRMRPPCEIPVP